ncbi:OB fold-containing protein [Cavenderia fasciculata]|uniref:OB fold-containing protein n=1 Tax=Cavenderia fasciculata TaxID=261658 RepID=F4PQE7_CACFS|nr:OB fold-containing protein [Cavenderia fasciculata]EGG22610.1 OB fold-containing protein [Cavenderia fasciculata]|eukprot:XP_004360461.1 OB fold-containing protein [Cavenderia fasciculata]
MITDEVTNTTDNTTPTTLYTTTNTTTTNNDSTTTKYNMSKETFNKLYPLLHPVNQTSDDSKLTLNIFDFDSTLFKSPEPNPELWTPSMVGKLKAMPSEDGLGWFQETATLDDPYVPSTPSLDWFNENVLKQAIQSINTPDTITCLLTGRTFIYEEIIKRILKSVQLNVNYMGLKMISEVGKDRVTTMDFKLGFINHVIDSVAPGRIVKIEMYDDRIKHVEQFRAFLQTIPNIERSVVHIDEKPQYIDEDQETKLVEELISRNGKEGFQLKKKVSYTGSVLDKVSVDTVLSWFDLPSDWVVKCHHSTMNMGAWEPKQWKTYVDKVEDEVEVSTTTTTTSTETTATATATITDQLAELSVSSSVTTATTTVEEQLKLKTTQLLATRYPVGSRVELTVEGIGLSGAALALKVSGAPTANDLPHITIAHHPRGKPVDSNKITHWKTIDEIIKDGHILSFVQENTTAATTSESTDAVKKESFVFPSISLKLKPITQLKLTSHVKEVGQSVYESTVATPKRKPAAGNNKAGGNNGNSNAAVNFGDLISKYHQVDKKEFGQLIGSIKQWASKEGVTDPAKIEEHIKSLNITTKKFIVLDIYLAIDLKILKVLEDLKDPVSRQF